MTAANQSTTQQSFTLRPQVEATTSYIPLVVDPVGSVFRPVVGLTLTTKQRTITVKACQSGQLLWWKVIKWPSLNPIMVKFQLFWLWFWQSCTLSLSTYNRVSDLHVQHSTCVYIYCMLCVYRGFAIFLFSKKIWYLFLFCCCDKKKSHEYD